MTILIDASLRCNLNCRYCYNAPLRRANVYEDINLDAIKGAVKRLVDLGWSRDIVLHGGEPLYWPREVLEELLAFSYKLTGKSALQTNGTLIDDEVIDLFKRYNTYVGVSIDGPGELNKFRCGPKVTEVVINNIRRLVEEKIGVGVIIVVHRANALQPQRERLKEFILWLKELGVTGRMNPCTHPDPSIQLTPQELTMFYLDMASFLEGHGIRNWSPFRDIVGALMGKPDVVCTFRGCDPFATPGGICVDSRGEIVPCHKFADKMFYYDGPSQPTRLEVLMNTDCKGCRYFYNCRGGCPGNAVGFDWRNKTRWCFAWKTLFMRYERLLRFMGIEPVIKLPGEYSVEELVFRPRPHSDWSKAVRRK